MKGIRQLRERRDALARDLNDLVDREKTPEWKPEHQAKYDQAMAEIADIDGQISRFNAVQSAIAEGAANRGEIHDDVRNALTRTPGAHSAETAAMRAFLSGGIAALAPDDLSRMRERQAVGDVAAAMRSLNPQGAMSTTTSTEGGYTVATEYFRQLIEAMKAFGGMRQVATVIQTGTGANMQFPTTDATSEEGEIVGQNAATNTGETQFGFADLNVFRYSSKKIALPWELLQDGMFDVGAYIERLLAMRIGRVTNRHFTVGTNSGQPNGMVPASTAGKVGATGQTVTVTYDDLVDLEHSVDPAYRSGPGVGYMMHDLSVSTVRKIKDTQGRPIFVPGYEQGNPGGAPDRLMNRPIIVNQQMATMAANAKSIAFGDFSKYLIREVMDLTLFRMTDSAFTLLGQVGFVAMNRQGGNLIDVGGAVKHYQNSAS